jgi:hypothetical protein
MCAAYIREDDGGHAKRDQKAKAPVLSEPHERTQTHGRLSALRVDKSVEQKFLGTK